MQAATQDPSSVVSDDVGIAADPEFALDDIDSCSD